MLETLKRHSPNALTSVRLILGLTFCLYPASWRLPLIIASLLTEYLDGALARRFQAQTRLGVFLDPIADKIFVFAVLLTLTWDNSIAPWELAWIVARDIIVTGAVIWFTLTKELGRIRGMQPAMPGKIATTLQFGLLIVLAAGYRWDPLIYATGLMSLLAGLDYIRRGRLHIRQLE